MIFMQHLSSARQWLQTVTLSISSDLPSSAVGPNGFTHFPLSFHEDNIVQQILHCTNWETQLLFLSHKARWLSEERVYLQTWNGPRS